MTLDDVDRDKAYLNIGLIPRAQGRYDDAAEALRAALELTPDYRAAEEAVASLEGIADAVRLASATPAPQERP